MCRPCRISLIVTPFHAHPIDGVAVTTKPINKKERAGYMRARSQADWRRDNPDRTALVLRDAIDRLGYPVMGYEYMVVDERGRWLWFDVAYTYREQTVFVDLKHKSSHSEKRAHVYKEEYCRREGIPFLVVPRQSIAEIQMAITVSHLTGADRP